MEKNMLRIKNAIEAFQDADMHKKAGFVSAVVAILGGIAFGVVRFIKKIKLLSGKL
jgi:hypothetical protein